MRSRTCIHCDNWIVWDFDPYLGDYCWQDGVFFCICVVAPTARHAPNWGRLVITEEP